MRKKVIRVVCRISRIVLAHAYVIPAYHFHMWPLKSLFANSHKCSDSILLYTCHHACRVGHDRNQSFCDMKNEWSLKLKLICIFNEDPRRLEREKQEELVKLSEKKKKKCLENALGLVHHGPRPSLSVENTNTLAPWHCINHQGTYLGKFPKKKKSLGFFMLQIILTAKFLVAE